MTIAKRVSKVEMNAHRASFNPGITTNGRR